jgi:hypothetical protein
MKISNYAICHLQKGSGNDSGMSQHIERKDAHGNRYVPDNADGTRTHLNRELIQFPEGVDCRSAAIQHRIDHAGLSRKVGKNQVHAIRIILTGTHEGMMQLEHSGDLNRWTAANLDWLRKTFGEDNVVSCVLHMDEYTPHLHATIVPIVTTERKRREREGEKKYAAKSGPRLSVSEVMSRMKLREYQSSYGAAMKPFGLQRGIVGSTANHLSRQQFNTQTIHLQEQRIVHLQEDIARLEAAATAQAASEAKLNAGAKLLSLIGRGELTLAKKENAAQADAITALKKQLIAERQQLSQMKQAHQSQVAQLKDGYQREIQAAIARAEKAEHSAEAKDRKIEELDRQAHPERYRLTSGATLTRFFIPSYLNPDLVITTRVGDIEYDARKYDIPYRLAQAHLHGQLTDWELVNELFAPAEQINQEQADLLGVTLELLSGGPTQVHIGTGCSGASGGESRWDGKKKDDFTNARGRRR